MTILFLAGFMTRARELFLLGEHDRAFARFKSIYEVDCTFRDVADIVNDYYDTAEDAWVAKYKARFGQRHGKT